MILLTLLSTLWMIFTWPGAITVVSLWIYVSLVLANMAGGCITDVCLSQIILSDKKFINFKVSGACCTTCIIFINFHLKMNVNTVMPEQSMLVLYPAFQGRQQCHQFVFVLSYSCLSTLCWNPPCLRNCNNITLSTSLALGFPVQGTTLALGIQNSHLWFS